MHDFTPASALIGGLLIGPSASILLYARSEIAGISGIYGKPVPEGTSDGCACHSCWGSFSRERGVLTLMGANSKSNARGLSEQLIVALFALQIELSKAVQHREMA